MVRLYADEDFSRPVVIELRAFGYDALTCQEAGQAGKGVNDSEILAYAIQESRAVLTFNRKHFFRLHRQVQPHQGIIACTRDDDVAALAKRIHDAIAGRDSLENILIRIVRGS